VLIAAAEVVLVVVLTALLIVVAVVIATVILSLTVVVVVVVVVNWNMYKITVCTRNNRFIESDFPCNCDSVLNCLNFRALYFRA
jgi:hypothetical protein